MNEINPCLQQQSTATELSSSLLTEQDLNAVAAGMDCATATKLAGGYFAIAGVLRAVGADAAAEYWTGRARGTFDGACR